VVYRNIGVTLRPPRDALHVVGWPAAYATCATGEAICPPGPGPSIVLADATSTGNNQLNDTPVYVLTFAEQGCAPAGPAPSPSPVPCTLMNFVDATTGHFLYAISSPSL
jgi:hypothetical protein